MPIVRSAGVGADARGNVYFTGEYAGTIRIGGGVLTSAGDTDMFLAKADPAGRVKWAVSMGGDGGRRARDRGRPSGQQLPLRQLLGHRPLRAPEPDRAGRPRGVRREVLTARTTPVAGRLGSLPFATLGELTLGPRYVSVLGRYTRSVQLGAVSLSGLGRTDFFVAGLPIR